MQELVIIHSNGIPYIMLRSHDLGGADYQPLKRIDEDVAHGLVAGTKIGWLHDEKPIEDVVPMRLRAVVREDASIKQAPWELIAAPLRSGADKNIGYLGSDGFATLWEFGGMDLFGGEEPDWTRAALLSARLELADLDRKRDIFAGKIERLERKLEDRTIESTDVSPPA